MLKNLLFLSFIEGAAVMAAELCGAKLLAPIFGSSLYVWASVMGITLAALAAGYFVGGAVSVASDVPSKTLFRILGAAALFMVLMPVVSHYLVIRLSYLPFAAGVIISTFCILFFPVFFLGASSPLFIVLQTNEAGQAGKVSGNIYAISTAGGISSTFFCGFYLIPVLGLNICMISFGLILFLSNFFVLKKFSALQLFLLLAAGYLNMQILLKNRNDLFRSDSILGRLEVSHYKTGKDSVRILKINDIIQTEMNLRTRKSVSQYLQLLDSLTQFADSDKKGLVLGLGGGLSANMLAENNYHTEGVEFDDRIIHCAKEFFFLDNRIITYHDDARVFINRCQKKYDVIIADIFKAEEQPSHVLTMESLLKLKNNLNDSARLLISWHGYLQGETGEGSRILYHTLLKAGYQVKVCSASSDERSRNLIFVASLEGLPELKSELAELIEPSEIINTDDKPTLEKYNAKANKAWRTQYLRYYQGLGEKY